MTNAIPRRSPQRRWRQGGLVLAWALTLVGSAVAQGGGDAYQLAVSDKITIRVLEWKAAESTFEDWTALGGEYVVGPTGTTSFPFVGETQSAGLSASELEAALSQGLQQALGLVSAPNVTVAITAFGPIYVTGDVQTPGEYSFSPGLNVVKALSLAGGERRTADAMARTEKELISATGALDVLQEQYLRLVARRVRLDAELANADTVTPPAEFADNPAAQGLIDAEQDVLEANARQLASQASAFEDQAALLTRELTTFEQKRQSVEQQLASAQEQLSNVRGLADDGLTLVSRVSSLEIQVADLEGRLLDIDTASLQARQDIGDAEKEKAQLADVRVSQLTLERQDVDAQLAELTLKLSTQNGLIREAEVFSGVTLTDAAQTYSYVILRDGEEIAADATTAVQAGDVVTARLNLSP